LIEVRPGICWWCQTNPADSREHKLKRSDLVREYGPPPYADERLLTRFSADGRHQISGPNSSLFKFGPSMCSDCNNTRSQAFDNAWSTFTAYLAEYESEIIQNRTLDLGFAFGSEWRLVGANVARYLVKHAICRMIDTLPGPLRFEADLIDFLDGGPFPESMQLEARLDLGVVEMLKVTRRAPAVDPRAAEAGFLNLGGVGVGRARDGTWHTPQSTVYYRWLVLGWRIGDGGPVNPFAQRRVELAESDELFGPAVREFLVATAEVPGEILERLPPGPELPAALRDAGYPEAAARLQALLHRQGSDRSQATSTGSSPGKHVSVRYSWR